MTPESARLGAVTRFGGATRRVSLASESYLGEYKDLEIQRWLDGMLSARGFQNRVPLLLILNVTFW